MSFLKRLSRHNRVPSYHDDVDYDNRPRSQDKYNSEKYHPDDSPRQSVLQHNLGPGSSPTKETNREMYSRSAHGPQEAMPHHGPPQHFNGPGSRQNSAAFETAPLSAGKIEQTPDLITQAFNQSLRPYMDKIDQLEAQVADMQAWVEQLEQQRNEIYSWIDKRGLRPDVPPAIAKAMDAQPDSATALNAQLDRKITIVNFDLHRLQDDLNDSISSSHFASAMSKFLPDISRLSALPGGSKFAFDLVLKLGGNLNSHGGLDPSVNASEAAADLNARRDFYARLDAAMVDVVRKRFQEGDEWPVQREIKRIEKTAAYLRNFGIEPYFPSTLATMKQEVEYRHAAPPPSTAQHAPATTGASAKTLPAYA